MTLSGPQGSTATFGPVFGNFGRFSPIEIPVRPGRTVAWRHGATWLGQMEDSVTEWSFGPEEENDLLAKLRRLADFQGGKRFLKNRSFIVVPRLEGKSVTTDHPIMSR